MGASVSGVLRAYMWMFPLKLIKFVTEPGPVLKKHAHLNSLEKF